MLYELGEQYVKVSASQVIPCQSDSIAKIQVEMFCLVHLIDKKNSWTPLKKQSRKKISFGPSPKIFFGRPQKKMSAKKINGYPSRKKNIYIKLDPHINFSSLHDNGDTICISQEIQCLPYVGFLLNLLNLGLNRCIIFPIHHHTSPPVIVIIWLTFLYL